MNNFRSLLVNFLSNTIGKLLIIVRPAKAKRLERKGMTLVMGNRITFSEKLMRRAILKKVEKNENFEALEEFHKNYWKNNGPEFFDNTLDRLHKDLVICEFIFEHLKEQLLEEEDDYCTLVEIGTGNGTVLSYLSEEFPDLQELIGIDLSNEQTIRNKKKYHHNSKLNFINQDGFEWVLENGHSNTIFLTFMGVLEYFTESRLEEFLKTIATLGNSIFIAIEPNGLEHDFIKNPNSEPYGTERSFSHNYLKLFEKSNFKIWHHSKKKIEGDNSIISFIGATTQF